MLEIVDSKICNKRAKEIIGEKVLKVLVIKVIRDYNSDVRVLIQKV